MANLETLCVQAGWTPKKGEPRVLPIYQSTTFKYDTSAQMADLFDLKESGYFFTLMRTSLTPTSGMGTSSIQIPQSG